MTPEVRALYQEVIVDHGRHPRNFGPMPEATHVLDGYNPLCGDKLKIYLLVKNNVIESVKFEGAGCAISMASASLMSQQMQGKTIEEAKQLFQCFHAMIIEGREPDVRLGKLTILEGVKEFPARVKCATLAWHTLQNALEGKNEVAVTE